MCIKTVIGVCVCVCVALNVANPITFESQNCLLYKCGVVFYTSLTHAVL